MSDVEIHAEKADRFDKTKFSVSEYIKQNFGMFTGEKITAKLKFEKSLVNVVLDQFGADTHLVKTDDGNFTIKAEVAATPVFLGWMFQFAGQAEIIEPQSLRTAMRDMLKTAGKMYGK